MPRSATSSDHPSGAAAPYCRNYAAQANNLTSDQLIDMLLEATPAEKQYSRPAA